MVTSFSYLVQTQMDTGDNWPLVVDNLQNKRQTWVWLLRFLGREVEYVQT